MLNSTSKFWVCFSGKFRIPTPLKPKTFIACATPFLFVLITSCLGAEDAPKKGSPPDGFDPSRFEIIEMPGVGDSLIVDKDQITSIYKEKLSAYRKLLSTPVKRVVLCEQTVMQDISKHDPLLTISSSFLAEDPIGRYLHYSRYELDPETNEVKRDLDNEPLLEQDAAGGRKKGIPALTPDSGSAMLRAGTGIGFLLGRGQTRMAEVHLGAHFGHLRPELLPIVGASTILITTPNEVKVFKMLEKEPDEAIVFKDGRVRFTWQNGALYRSILLSPSVLLPISTEVYHKAVPVSDSGKSPMKFVTSATSSKWDVSGDVPALESVEMTYQNPSKFSRVENTLRTSMTFKTLPPETPGYEVFFDSELFGLLTPPVKLKDLENAFKEN